MTLEYQQSLSDAAAVRQREDEERRQEEARKQAEIQRQQQEAQPKVDLAQQEAELRQQAERAEKIANLQDPETARGLAILQQTNPQEFQKTQEGLKKEAPKAIARAEIVKAQRDFETQIANVEKQASRPDITVDVEALNRAKAAVEENRRIVDAITSKELAPYIKFTKDGSYIINVHDALKNGVDKNTLYDANISIAKVQKELQRIEKGQGPSEAFLTPEEAKKQIQLETIVYRYEKRQQIDATKKLKDYIDKETKALDVEEAVKDGVSLRTIQQAGYDLQKKQYDNIVLYQTAKGEDKFNLLVKDGIIPQGSIYAGDDAQGNPTYYTKEQKSTMDKLEKHDYNLALMLKKDIVTEKELSEVGFSIEDIDKAKLYVKASNETGVALEGESKYLRDWYKDFEKAENALNEKIAQIEKNNPTYSKDKVTELVLKTPEYQKIKELNSKLDPLKTEQSVGLRGAITATSFIFPPAKAGKPEYTMSDVSALDWGVGIANVALFVVPFAAPATTIGRGIVTGTQLAAGGIYTADTVKNWADMNNTQRGISVAIDTLLLASAASPYAGSIARATNKGINSVKANLNTTVTKSEDMISHLFKKSPVKNTGVSPMKHLTEGGVIGPYKNFTDVQLVQSVANGQKPLAFITNVGDDIRAIKLAKEFNLKLKYSGKTQLYAGDIAQTMGENGIKQIRINNPTIVKEYVVYADNPTGRIALDKLNKAALIDRTTPEGLIKYHTQVGEALGYKPQDIRAFMDAWAGTDASVKEAWNNLKYAMALKDKALIKESAARLQLAAARLPKQIGDPLMRRAKLIAANTDDWLSLVEKAPDNPGNISKGIDANKQFIENAERQLRKISSAKRREEIARALEEARKQVKKTAVKTKVKEPLQKVINPEEVGKNVPAIFKSTETVLVPTKGPAGVTVKQPIPKKEFATTPITKLSKKYRVSREELIEKVSSMPIDDRVVIVSRNIPGLSPEERKKILPISVPDLSTPGVTSTEIQPQTVTKTSTKIDRKTGKITIEKVKPIAALKPETETKPKAKPKTTISTSTTVKPVPKTKPEPLMMPKPEIKTGKETPTQTKAKLPKKSSKKEEYDWTEEDIKSAIAWKDGFNVVAIKYPYRRGIDERSFHESKVPPGLVVLDVHGKGSEQKSITVKGKVKKTTTVDVGNQDKIIRPVQGGHAVIIESVFDPGGASISDMTIKRKNRKTSKPKKTPVRGYQNLSKRKGKLYNTKAGGGTMISRRPIHGY